MDGPAELPAPLASVLEPGTGPTLLSGEAQMPAAEGLSPVGEEFVLEQPVIGCTTNNILRMGEWYAGVDGVFLLRADVNAIFLAQEIIRPIQNSRQSLAEAALVLNSPPFRYEPGLRATVGHRIGEDLGGRYHALEGTFFGLFEWESQAELIANDQSTFVGPGQLAQLVSPRNGLPGFENAQRQFFDYTSQFHSFEVNYRIRSEPARDRSALQADGAWIRHGGPAVQRSVLAGFRAIDMEEHFLFGSEVGNAARDGGSYDLRLDNNLYGIQFGGEWMRMRPMWHAGIRGKIGGLINFADRVALLQTRQNRSPLDTATNDSDEQLGFVAELGFVAGYRIRPNMTARLAYDALYLQGVSVASGNIVPLTITSFGPFNVEGDAVYHGISCGIEVMW